MQAFHQDGQLLHQARSLGDESILIVSTNGKPNVIATLNADVATSLAHTAIQKLVGCLQPQRLARSVFFGGIYFVF